MYNKSFQLSNVFQIIFLSKAADFEKTGKWKLDVKDLKTGKTETKIYDSVILCTGHHAEKNIVTFPGMDKFKGKIVHSHDYKDTKVFENKRVVVVGIGNSGGDAVVELSRICSQVYRHTLEISNHIHAQLNFIQYLF